MFHYNNQGGGEQFPIRARLRNMHKSYIFSMAQIQGVKIYEAPRRRLSYFALWHRPTKIDAMFEVTPKPLACLHLDAERTRPWKADVFKLKLAIREVKHGAKVDQTTLERIVTHKWSSGRRPGRRGRSASRHCGSSDVALRLSLGSAATGRQHASSPLSSCKLPQTKLKPCVVTAELQTGCNQTPQASCRVLK